MLLMYLRSDVAVLKTDLKLQPSCEIKEFSDAAVKCSKNVNEIINNFRCSSDPLIQLASSC